MRPRVESLLQFTIRSANFRSFWDLLSPGKSQNLKIETLAFFVSKIVTLQIEAFLPLSVCSMILGCLEYQVVGVLVDVVEYEIYYGVLHMYVVIRTRTSLRASLLSIGCC